jgi:hypothetical protein
MSSKSLGLDRRLNVLDHEREGSWTRESSFAGHLQPSIDSGRRWSGVDSKVVYTTFLVAKEQLVGW